MKRKILITGSAPYFPQWWKENVSKLEGYLVYSMNTSIMITHERANCWIRSSDFFDSHGDLKAFLDPIGKHLDVKFKEEHPVLTGVPMTEVAWPFLYWKNKTSGTMLFNVLIEIANDFFWRDNTDEVSIIGCDLVYKENQKNHFYDSGGTNDPMRLGEDCLKINLRMFKMLYAKLGVGLYNLSPADETLLPFEKKIL